MRHFFLIGLIFVIGLTKQASSFVTHNIQILHANQPYQEWSQPKEKMAREFRILKEGMSGQWLNYKAHLAAITHIKTPAYKRYKYVNYLNKDEDIIPIQYIDWTKERPVLSHRPLDVYSSGKFDFFCLEPDNDVDLYTLDGRFYVDPIDNRLKSIQHRRPIMGVDGYIILRTTKPVINEIGEIFDGNKKVAQFKIASFKSSKGLWTIDGTVFYQRYPKKVQINETPNYNFLQGYYEAQNEPPGMMTSKLITPYAEATAKSTKKYLDTYELFFEAVIEK